jgi:lactam utilization protein B
MENISQFTDDSELKAASSIDLFKNTYLIKYETIANRKYNEKGQLTSFSEKDHKIIVRAETRDEMVKKLIKLKSIRTYLDDMADLEEFTHKDDEDRVVQLSKFISRGGLTIRRLSDARLYDF